MEEMKEEKTFKSAFDDLTKSPVFAENAEEIKNASLGILAGAPLAEVVKGYTRALARLFGPKSSHNPDPVNGCKVVLIVATPTGENVIGAVAPGQLAVADLLTRAATKALQSHAEYLVKLDRAIAAGNWKDAPTPNPESGAVDSEGGVTA